MRVVADRLHVQVRTGLTRTTLFVDELWLRGGMADSPTPNVRKVSLGEGKYALVATGSGRLDEGVPYRTCERCGASFARKSNRGPWPKYCPACRMSPPTRTWVSHRTATASAGEVQGAVEDRAEASSNRAGLSAQVITHRFLEPVVDWSYANVRFGLKLGGFLVIAAGAFLIGFIVVWAVSLATNH